jgi:hypothetical protein
VKAETPKPKYLNLNLNQYPANCRHYWPPDQVMGRTEERVQLWLQWQPALLLAVAVRYQRAECLQVAAASIVVAFVP